MLDRLAAPLTTLVVFAAVCLAFSNRAAASTTLVYALLGPYALLGALALYRLRRNGSLAQRLRFRWGDISFAALVAALLIAGCWVGRAALARPDSPREAWIMRIYLQLGELPSDRGALLGFAFVIVMIALLEELVWRGLVQDALATRLGVRRAWLTTTALYGLAHLPTVWLLAVPGIGANPLVVIAALFCGCVWGFLAGRLDRLPPSLLAHAFFTYVITTQLPLWSLR